MTRGAMRANESGRNQLRTVHALLAILATLAVGAGEWAGETWAADATAAEIAAKAEASASELAASVHSLESSLRTAPPIANEGKVLSVEENDALVEAGVKEQLAGLAGELDQLSAALASGKDLDGEKILLESLARRAAALSKLGARPSRLRIPPELHGELLALWSDVQALSVSRAEAPAAAADPMSEVVP